jgi:hypothetical protein
MMQISLSSTGPNSQKRTYQLFPCTHVSLHYGAESPICRIERRVLSLLPPRSLLARRPHELKIISHVTPNNLQTLTLIIGGRSHLKPEIPTRI